MDLGNIIYIVAVIAYFIYQATRKKGGQDLPDTEGPNPETPKKGMSFEELLKEIRDSQKPLGEERLPERKPKPAPVPVEIPRANPVVRKPARVEEDDEEAQYYEGAYRSGQSNPYQAFRETVPTEPASVKFDYSSLKTKKTNPYAELLKNPKTLKDAVVVSEILKPKYF
ncbi:hypothetical protein J0A68_19335 [Algoriphagus sp. H41]|uniref:Uncharacterized protein n=1 Tax=Algoriphagus oliviformis TaxID=2811231 RepID=A0ABS3C7P4_9BACT|nr:hypothetical protein [Algoriphagus oliviformis]MBN7813117.1 hypothetical protein [Algoriphagus oliviformis]